MSEEKTCSIRSPKDIWYEVSLKEGQKRYEKSLKDTAERVTKKESSMHWLDAIRIQYALIIITDRAFDYRIDDAEFRSWIREFLKDIMETIQKAALER